MDENYSTLLAQKPSKTRRNKWSRAQKPATRNRADAVFRFGQGHSRSPYEITHDLARRLGLAGNAPEQLTSRQRRTQFLYEIPAAVLSDEDYIELAEKLRLANNLWLRRRAESPDARDILVWIKDRLRTAGEKKQPPKQAICDIASIWEQLDKTAQLAEAKSRILLGKVTEPDLAPVPVWFQEQVSELHEFDEQLTAAHPLAIDSASRLVQACLYAVSEAKDLDAELSRMPLGNVLVDWGFGQNILQWIVQPVELPWPGAKVHVLSLESGKAETKPNTRIFYNAFDLVEHFRDQWKQYKNASNERRLSAAINA